MGARHLQPGTGPVLIAGVAGALDRSLRPGDLVVASEVRAGGDAIACDTTLADELGARVGPIASVERIASREEKRRLAAAGALAVDMESYWLAASAGARPVAVVRAIVDIAGRSVVDPRTIPAGIAALRALRRAAPCLGQWAEVMSRS